MSLGTLSRERRGRERKAILKAFRCSFQTSLKMEVADIATTIPTVFSDLPPRFPIAPKFFFHTLVL